jgi:hypothetical protein
MAVDNKGLIFDEVMSKARDSRLIPAGM